MKLFVIIRLQRMEDISVVLVFQMINSVKNYEWAFISTKYIVCEKHFDSDDMIKFYIDLQADGTIKLLLLRGFIPKILEI